MATIYGTCSTNPTRYSYYAVWSESNVSIVNNTSDVTVEVYVQKISTYNSEAASNPQTLYIDGTAFSDNNAIDMNPETTPRLCNSGTKTITHSADGSKSITISALGSLPTGGGYGPTSGTLSATVALTTIPRAASITSSSDLTIGNNLAYTLSNAGSLYVKLEYYVYDGASWDLVSTSNEGTGSSGTITMGATENNIMYAAMPNTTSRACILRAKTYSDSGYSTQVGSDYDKAGTIYVNQAINNPTFTTFTVGNLDKNIAVVDKYANALVTSSTSTLLGSDTKMIKGYSKLRAVVTTANKMVALNSATPIKYRFVAGALQNEQNYSAGSTVNLDIDNALTKDVSVAAIDSRSLVTTVTASLANMVEPTPISLWGLTLTRDNGVDSETKLAFSGLLWKEYFGGGANGVANTVTCHWRYKLTTEAWGAQTWTAITATDDGSGNLSYDEYIEGDLGVSGFDVDKSFDIEVRAFDKISQTIIEQTLSVGTPVIDITKDGIAIMGKYDVGVGGSLQVDGLPVGSSGNSLQVDCSGGTSDTYGVLGGLVNSSNTVYTVSLGSYISGSLRVYLNGRLETQGSGEDWVETTPASGTFTFATAPATGEIVTAVYQFTTGTTGNADTLDGVHLSGLLDMFYPVGTIYETTSTDLDTTTKMGTHFGGTWEAYGAGQVLVAKSADTEFDTIGETGGAKTVTLTSAQSGVPAHTHGFGGYSVVTNQTGYNNAASAAGLNIRRDGPTATDSNSTANASSAHNNLQPYIVVYRYRRTV